MVRKASLPKMYRHKSGQARVRIKGRDHYLGKYGTREAEERYRELVGKFLLQSGGTADDPERRQEFVTVNELLAAFWEHAKRHYVKHGGPTSELGLMGDAVKEIRQSHGEMACADFRPRHLKTVRERLIARGIVRTSVNRRIGRIVRIFAWGVENELIPAQVHHALNAVGPINRGRAGTVESSPVKPVPVEDLNATLPFLNRQVKAMVLLQAKSGMRPGEVCIIRPCDVDTSRDVWTYMPSRHKTEHHGAERVVYLGPQCQEILQPFLDREPEAFCFSPAEAEAERRANMRARRKSKVQPSQANRTKRNPKRVPRERYDVTSYRRSIRRACNRALKKLQEEAETTGEAVTFQRWKPNQLRHLAGTTFRRDYGLEASQIMLGHTEADVTQVYAETDAALAEKVAMEIG